MGSYITQTGGASPVGDLTDEIGNTNLATVAPNGSGGVDVTKTERAIVNAEALIDGMLGADYTTPLTPIPPVIKTIARFFAVYFLYEGRPEFTNANGDGVGEKRYKMAKALLDEFRKRTPPLQATSYKETTALLGSLVGSDEQRDPIE